jgi:hypothetical protein
VNRNGQAAVPVSRPGLRMRGSPGRRRGGAAAVLRVLALSAAAVLTLAPAPATAQQDTTRVAADTVPADTTLTPRQRAIERLRALRIDPVQPDTTAADSAAADTLSADTTGVIRVPGPAGDTLDVGEGVPPSGGVVGVGDTVVAFADDTLGDPGVVPEDSVLRLLRGLAGYASTRYEGEAAVFRADSNQLELTGASRVEQAGSTLETDSVLVYDGQSGIVCGYGAPVLSGEADPIESDEICFNIDRNVGVAVRARTTFNQGATWYVRGGQNRVYLLTGGDKNALYGEYTEFTSCSLDHPHYTFRAQSVKMVEDETMVARNITLRFEDVPVFWLPWMVQSMKRGRRSGLLMPEFGVNDIVRNGTGYNRHLSNLGFYWAMNDYMSAKGTFEWYSSNWTAVEGALTYKWLRQFLNGNLTAKHFWRQQEGGPSSREFTLNTSNSWQPDERTRVQLNARYASDNRFVQNNSFDPRELNREITSNASISRSFRWGSVALGADRQESLGTGRVNWKLPGVNLNISPVTLFEVGDGLELTWNGSGNYTRRTRDFPSPVDGRDQETVDAGYNHRLSFGRLGLSQDVSWSDELLGARPAVDSLETAAEPEELTQRLTWSSSMSYQQTLWPGTTLSPTVSINGSQLKSPATSSAFVQEPNRVAAGASLNTSIYGFWPGFGRFSRIRHKIAPTLRWSYSPAPSFSPLQDSIFGSRNLRERNELSLSFSQTFEAKVKEEAVPDSVQTDSAEAAVSGAGAVPGMRGEPRRLPQAEKVLLLALDTRTSFQYDFVAAREDGRGFQTRSVSNSIRSDLLRGLQITMTHDLFRGDEGSVGDDEPLPDRTFDPFLTNLQASFSIDSNFWLFDLLGLTSPGLGPGHSPPPDEPEAEGVAGSLDPQVGAEADPSGGLGVGAIVAGDEDETRGGGGGGGWRASLNFAMTRARPGAGGADNDSQLLSCNFSFDPTELWSVRWSTAYSFSEGEFANHRLTLSRDLHRWQANFDFIKAQNGNFAMQFRVELRDNPDLKLDYDQRTDPSERALQP